MQRDSGIPFEVILLMVQQSSTTTWDEGNPVNNWVNYQPQLVIAGFLHISYIKSMSIENCFDWKFINTTDVAGFQWSDVEGLNQQVTTSMVTLHY